MGRAVANGMSLDSGLSGGGGGLLERRVECI